MDPAEWKLIVSTVTDRMNDHVRAFGTPLVSDDGRIAYQHGSGNYLERDRKIVLLTCEHVVRGEAVRFRFNGKDAGLEPSSEWVADSHPVDAAFQIVPAASWGYHDNEARAIAPCRIARKHDPHCQEELMFFRGYAGENARYAFSVHQVNASGYCTQEVQESGDDELFELFWEPLHTQFTLGTLSALRSETRYDNAEGFSGSLVWNTRYLEVTGAGGVWTPEDAVVTGLLRRWDQKTKTLLAWRAEHLQAWLTSKGV